ncbi:hypothetical protein FY036_12195 [Mesorhizobium microcysteis]|uniref:Uncharacterized protein n=1 Tax=Neoaquamicrobium microcysteis TaxID=2682781 RepID=A0A5D4GSV8_9HYPH|nr:hypothetical protein [Mesorhizobium microcysteis]TYR31856.1 hypothetical protein FY036_12195 [Mesorhizobium microcysteis]
MTNPNADNAAHAASLSSALKDFHRSLIRAEIGDDPALQNNPYTMLFALIGDPRFAWMGALSELIARIDQTVADGEAADIEIVFAFREEAAALIGEGGGESVAAFRLRHLTALQNEPEVGLATGRLRKALSAIPSKNR